MGDSKRKITIWKTLKPTSGAHILIYLSTDKNLDSFVKNTDIILMVAMIVLPLSVWDYDVEGNESLLLKVMVQKLHPKYPFNPIINMIIPGSYHTCYRCHFPSVISLNQFLRNVICLKGRTTQ